MQRSLAEQSSSEPPSKQPITNQGEDINENSNNGSGFASDLCSSYDSRSGTGTPTMISKFANLAKRRAEDLVWNRNVKLLFTIHGLQ